MGSPEILLGACYKYSGSYGARGTRAERIGPMTTSRLWLANSLRGENGKLAGSDAFFIELLSICGKSTIFFGRIGSIGSIGCAGFPNRGRRKVA
jgi:hypothetical protein